MSKFINLSLLLCLYLVFWPGLSNNAQVVINNLDSTSLYSYEWFLYKMPKTNLYHVDNSRIPNLLFFPGENGKFSGRAECNEIEGLLTLPGNNKLHITKISEDVYECNHDFDRKFISMLQKVDHYKIQHDQLKLYTMHGLLLAKFYADFTESSFYPMTGLEGEWIQNLLKRPNGWANLDLLDTVPWISFTKSNTEKISGFTGNNSFTGNFKIENFKIHFSEIKKMEENVGDSELEKDFIGDLLSTTNFRLGRELLSFWKGGSLVLDFKRKYNLSLTKGAVWRFLKKKEKRTTYVCGN